MQSAQRHPHSQTQQVATEDEHADVNTHVHLHLLIYQALVTILNFQKLKRAMLLIEFL